MAILFLKINSDRFKTGAKLWIAPNSRALFLIFKIRSSKVDESLAGVVTRAASDKK